MHKSQIVHELARAKALIALYDKAYSRLFHNGVCKVMGWEANLYRQLLSLEKLKAKILENELKGTDE